MDFHLKKITMRNLVFILLLSTSLVNCKSMFFYEDSYSRKNRKNTHFEPIYSSIDSVIIRKFILCEENLEAVNKTDGQIEFNRVKLKSSVVKSLRDKFQSVRYVLNYGSIDRNDNCEQYIHNNFLKSKESFYQNQTSNYILDISFSIEYISSKNTDVDAMSASPYNDLGNDKHAIEYKIILALSKENTLIYLDNQAHWTKVFSERGEQLQYEVPQKVVDSLVSLSLEEYYKRLE